MRQSISRCLRQAHGASPRSAHSPGRYVSILLRGSLPRPASPPAPAPRRRAGRVRSILHQKACVPRKYVLYYGEFPTLRRAFAAPAHGGTGLQRPSPQFGSHPRPGAAPPSEWPDSPSESRDRLPFLHQILSLFFRFFSARKRQKTQMSIASTMIRQLSIDSNLPSERTKPHAASRVFIIYTTLHGIVCIWYASNTATMCL